MGIDDYHVSCNYPRTRADLNIQEDILKMYALIEKLLLELLEKTKRTVITYPVIKNHCTTEMLLEFLNRELLAIKERVR